MARSYKRRMNNVDGKYQIRLEDNDMSISEKEINEFNEGVNEYSEEESEEFFEEEAEELSEEDLEREEAERHFKEMMFKVFSEHNPDVRFDEETGCIVIPRPVRR